MLLLSSYQCGLFGISSFLCYGKLDSSVSFFWPLCKYHSFAWKNKGHRPFITPCDYVHSWAKSHRSATIISILRVNASSHIDVLDVTWGYVPIAEYTTVEANVGILCACLPVLAPLVSSCFKRQVGSHNLEQGAFSANTVNIKHAQTSRREQKSLSLEEDEAALVSSNSFATVSRHPEGTSNQDYANEQDGTMRLGQITVRKDIHVESCVQV